VNKPVNLYYFYLCIHIFFYFSIFLFFYFFIFFYTFFYIFRAGPNSAHMGWARPSQPSSVTGPSQWPGWATLGTRDLKSRVHGLVIELNTDDENGIRQSGGNRAEDLPGSFAGKLRVIAEDDASAFEFLLTPSAFHIVFLSCVSVSVYFSLFLLLCFQNEPMLSLGQFCFFVVLGRYWWGKGSLLVWGLTRKLRNPSGLFVSVLFRVCFLSLSLLAPALKCCSVYIGLGGW